MKILVDTWREYINAKSNQIKRSDGCESECETWTFLSMNADIEEHKRTANEIVQTYFFLNSWKV